MVFPMPMLSTDGTDTEEIDNEESTCEEWVAPLKDYMGNPKWGGEIEHCRSKLKTAGGEETVWKYSALQSLDMHCA